MMFPEAEVYVYKPLEHVHSIVKDGHSDETPLQSDLADYLHYALGIRQQNRGHDWAE